MSEYVGKCKLCNAEGHNSPDCTYRSPGLTPYRVGKKVSSKRNKKDKKVKIEE